MPWQQILRRVTTRLETLRPDRNTLISILLRLHTNNRCLGNVIRFGGMVVTVSTTLPIHRRLLD